MGVAQRKGESVTPNNVDIKPLQPRAFSPAPPSSPTPPSAYPSSPFHISSAISLPGLLLFPHRASAQDDGCLFAIELIPGVG